MTPTQQHLLKLILEIDAICQKYDIDYYIDYGTTLGAVRHKGFIPWDDDLDIQFTEPNYYKWVEACKKELDPSKRVYNDVRLDREFPTVFGRYNDLESARVGRKSEFWKPIAGQCIDVFYLLELPGDPVKKQEAIDLYFAYDEYSNASYRHYRMKTERWMEIYEKCCKWEKIVGRERVLQHLEKQIFHKHYDDCDTYICTSARKSGPTSIVPKFCYDTIKRVEFEGHMLPIAGKYIELMNVYYEDTWNIIPEVKKVHSQQSHTNIPVGIYHKDYMRMVDKDAMLKERLDFKKLDVEEGYRFTRWNNMFFPKVALMEKLRIEKLIRERSLDINDLTDVTDRDKLAVLDELFSDYYKKQMNSSTRVWECYLDLGEDLVYSALVSLLYYRNDYYSTSKILNLRDVAGKPEDPRFTELREIIDRTRRVKAAIYYKELDRAKEELDSSLEKFPYMEELQLCRLDLDVLLADTAEKQNDCKARAEEILALKPESDRALKALGDIAWKQGDKETADKHYDWILENSKDAMMHLDIREKRGEL